VFLVRLVAPGTQTTGPKITLPNADYTHKNITSNFQSSAFNTPWGRIRKAPKHVGAFNCLL